LKSTLFPQFEHNRISRSLAEGASDHKSGGGGGGKGSGQVKATPMVKTAQIVDKI
tara:strand:+ start:227 stop:391 length:165 start_codon:yes stop_codon:yes gene_type:complete